MTRLIAALLMLLSLPAAAQPVTVPTTVVTQPAPPAQSRLPVTIAGSFLEGSWALRLDGAIVMRFDLKRQGDGWTGAWVKPKSFRTDRGGHRFGEIVMPSVARLADSGKAIGDWAEITFDDPRPGAVPDVFRFHLLSADRAEVIYVGTGMAPYTLERVAAGAILGPFEEGGVYDERSDNPRIAESPPPVAVPRPARVTPTPAQGPPAQGTANTRPPAVIGR